MFLLEVRTICKECCSVCYCADVGFACRCATMKTKCWQKLFLGFVFHSSYLLTGTEFAKKVWGRQSFIVFVSMTPHLVHSTAERPFL